MGLAVPGFHIMGARQKGKMQSSGGVFGRPLQGRGLSFLVERSDMDATARRR